MKINKQVYKLIKDLFYWYDNIIITNSLVPA